MGPIGLRPRYPSLAKRHQCGHDPTRRKVDEVDAATLFRTIAIPLWAARAWLRDMRPVSEHPAEAISDVPEREKEVSERSRTSGHRLAFRWAGVDDPLTGAVGPEELRPGDLIVVPAEYGGCDKYGWLPRSSSCVEDVADHASVPFRGRRHAVRIARDVVANPAQWHRVSELLGQDGITGADLVERLLLVLPSKEVTESDSEVEETPLRWAKETLAALQRARGGKISVEFPYPGGREQGAVLVAERGITDNVVSNDDGTPWTESDDLSQTAERPVSLEEHTESVARFTRRFAGVLGLDEKVTADLCLAAFLHDAGKADRRFQTVLSGGNPWNRSEGRFSRRVDGAPFPAPGSAPGLPNGLAS